MNEHNQTTQSDPLIQLLFDDGLQNAFPRIAEILMNAAMLLEREQHIGAAPHQRGVERNGYGNGFKPRTFQTGIGALELAVPQVRESDTPFRTSLLEKGSRSDRALKSAIATMYVEGVSTRRVTRVMEQMCGFEVSSGQVSNLNKQLDEEFEKWRNRSLPEIALAGRGEPSIIVVVSSPFGAGGGGEEEEGSEGKCLKRRGMGGMSASCGEGAHGVVVGTVLLMESAPVGGFGGWACGYDGLGRGGGVCCCVMPPYL